MKLPVWPFRIIILTYFFYKMFLSDPYNSIIPTLDFAGESPGFIAGEIFAFLLLTFIFCIFYIYQIKQGLSEFKGVTGVSKVRFRLFSIVFSIIFFSLAASSLVNADFSQIEIASYMLELYSMFTLIAVLASIVVVVKDIKLYREFRRTRSSGSSAG